MNLKFYLDTRAVSDGKPAPLKLSICHNSKSALMPLGILLTKKQFNPKTERVENHPNKLAFNAFLAQKRLDVENLILELNKCRKLARMSATELKNYIQSRLDNKDQYNSVKTLFNQFIETKSNESTISLYRLTMRHLQAFCRDFDSLCFEDINIQFLMKFDKYLMETSPSKNSRNIHLRNIRSVFNFALDLEVTSYYPFRKFEIKPMETSKRSLSIDQLRRFMTMPLMPFQEQYRDMFMLMFYLIGINSVDLFNLKCIVDGRIDYWRAKTGRHYSIKVEPEALSIINKYRGKNYLLNVLDRYKDYKDYRKRMNKALQRFGKTDILNHGKKVIESAFPKISTYWARHTWASIAANCLDIPKDVIAHALGHGNNTVTDIYIDFDQRKVDEANRKVIDYVLYS